MKKNIILLVFITFFIHLGAINENAGTSGFSFFKISYSARAAALSHAYTALSDQLDAVFFNPAGLTQLKQKQVSATYMSYFDGINCGSAVYAQPLKNDYYMAAFTQFLTASEDRTLVDENGNYAGTDGSFGVSEFLVGASLGKHFSDLVNVGVNLKILQESIDSNSATAVAVDFSILHQTTNQNLKVGLTIKNIGKQLSYYSDEKYEENLPQVLQAGFSYHPDPKVYINFDLYKPLEYDFSALVGVEYHLHHMFCMRAGYKSNSSDWKMEGDYDSFAGISMGFGLNWQNYNLDYAINSYGDLGFVNQITLRYNF
ncbi:MAG: PorV/PorQ family protein [Candidatus Cloacimonadota bacterium]|nr:PorV/PorQ family protein [Candidatus Cloacimonadota bacterium]